jgi:hypothetical protein
MLLFTCPNAKFEHITNIIDAIIVLNVFIVVFLIFNENKTILDVKLRNMDNGGLKLI